MRYITFDQTRPYDLVLLGRVAVDFNPVDYFQPLEECTTFKKYVGGSPANIAVGAARHGMKIGFFARVSDDQLGDFVVHFFEKEGIDTSRIRRCENGEKIGLTFTEILSRDESSILMYRNCIADLQLHPDDIDEEYIRSAKTIVISGTALAASPSREAAIAAYPPAEPIPIQSRSQQRSNLTSSAPLSILFPSLSTESIISTALLSHRRQKYRQSFSRQRG
jgi:5-dehydro-2-deoxygluconokinase